MKQYEAEATLAKMVGKRYIYNKKQVRVVRSEIKEKIVRIVTDIEDVILLHEDFDEGIQRFQPVAEEYIPAVSSNSGAISHPKGGSQSQALTTTVLGSSVTNLRDILLDNIEKVRANKDFIPQAVEINNQVKSIIELGKAEVELLKVLRS